MSDKGIIRFWTSLGVQGWESARQHKGHRSDPWSGKIPRAAGQLSPQATTTEPLLPGARACVNVWVLLTQSSDSFQPPGLWPASLLCPWDSPGKNTGEGCHSLLQGIFPIQDQICVYVPYTYRQVLYPSFYLESSPPIQAAT